MSDAQDFELYAGLGLSQLPKVSIDFAKHFCSWGDPTLLQQDYQQHQQNEYMKQKLTGDQFGRRYPLLEPHVLAEMLERYADNLARDTNRCSILLAEIPLKHELLKRPDLPPGKDGDIIVTLLRGYRIYRVTRRKPADPTLLAIFSRMTRCWHRVGYADLGGAAAVWQNRERYSDAGCSALSGELLGQGPHAVENPLLLRCMVADLLPPDYRYYVASLSRGRWDNSNWVLGEAMKGCRLTPDKDTPGPVALARVLNSDRPSLSRIWELVDRYGFPDGPLGDTLKHMDKFRTF